MFHFWKKTDISQMSLGKKLGRLATGALSVAGGVKFLAVMGMSFVILAAVPILILPTLALLGACAMTGVSLHAVLTDIHTREFSTIFYQLTSGRDQNGSPLFSLENIEHEAPVGGSPKILTSIYLGGTEVAAALSQTIRALIPHARTS